MKNKTLILILSFVAISCSTQTIKKDYRFITLPEAINSDLQKKLTAEEVAYDLSQVLYALDTAYSGKRFLPKGQYNELVQKIKSIQGEQTVSQFCENIDRFMDAVSDNHLAAKFNHKSCFKSPNSKDGKVGPNFYKEKNEIPWNVKISKRGKAKAMLISIVSFPASTNPVWNGFIESVKRDLSKVDFIILDMRGNGGGDDSKGWALATLLAGAELKQPYSKQWNNPSAEAQQIIVNSIEYWERIERKERGTVSQHLVDLKKKYESKRDQILGGNLEKPSQDDNDGEDFNLNKSIKKPIYILIDADCASSCESTTDFFENNALVKTVGENTAGYVHFGNNGNVILKNSGIALQMAISYNSYKDGRFIEKAGITPKIKVPESKDAMDFAWGDFKKK